MLFSLEGLRRALEIKRRLKFLTFPRIQRKVKREMCDGLLVLLAFNLEIEREEFMCANYDYILNPPLRLWGGKRRKKVSVESYKFIAAACV